MNETLIAVLEVPLIVRAAVVMFIIWLVYLLIAGFLVKVVAAIPMLFNWIWMLIYRIVGGLTHILHSTFGKPFMGVDQTISDFFGSIHNFVDSIKSAIQNAGKSKRPFAGAAFVLALVVTGLIALPVWLDAQYDENLFTLPYRTYTTFENWFFDTVFND
jgi:hypothetical protein